MARIRTLKPEILEDERTASLSDAAFRLFIAMIVMADDYGNLRASESWLLGQVWWSCGNPPRIAEILRELRRSGLIGLHGLRGQAYASISGWARHQRITNAGKPRVPRPFDDGVVVISDDCTETAENPPRDSANLGKTPPDLRSPITDQDPEGDPDLGSTGDAALASGPKQTSRSRVQRKKPRTGWPDGWEPDRGQVPPGFDYATQMANFRDHHAAAGNLFADWPAAWRKWCRNAPTFARWTPSPQQNSPTRLALVELAELEEAERKNNGGAR